MSAKKAKTNQSARAYQVSSVWDRTCFTGQKDLKKAGKKIHFVSQDFMLNLHASCSAKHPREALLLPEAGSQEGQNHNLVLSSDSFPAFPVTL